MEKKFFPCSSASLIIFPRVSIPWSNKEERKKGKGFFLNKFVFFYETRIHIHASLRMQGGNAPFIVFDDANVDAAVSGAIASKVWS